MDLKKKGEEAQLGGIKQFMVTLKWTTAADFDLAALYEGKDGKIGLVYFGQLGDLNSYPFMQLSGDEGVGDSGGDNSEEMRVAKIDDLNNIWIICWEWIIAKSITISIFLQWVCQEDKNLLTIIEQIIICIGIDWTC